MKLDLLVIGGGAAGCAAALAAAVAGASVRVVTAGEGATRLSPGFIDIADDPTHNPAAPWLQNRSLETNLAALCERFPDHPYRLIGTAAEVLGALQRFRGWLAGVGFEFAGDGIANRALVTTFGTAKLTAFYPAWWQSAEAASLSGKRLLIAELAGYPTLSGEFLAAALPLLNSEIERIDSVRIALQGFMLPVSRNDEPANSSDYCRSWQHGFSGGGDALKDAGCSSRGATSLPNVFPRLAEVMITDRFHNVVANRFERGELLVELRSSLAAALKNHPGTELVFVPPVLGLKCAGAITSQLSQDLGCLVSELPDPLSRIAGQRLLAVLQDCCRRSGIPITNARAVKLQSLERHVAGIEIAFPDHSTEILSASAFLLATGRFLAGGIRLMHGEMTDELTGLPAKHRGDRVRLSDHDRFVAPGVWDEQPLFAAGLPADSRFRPLDAEGAPAWLNLHIAGELLGGYDHCCGQGGLGVAIATGMAAAQRSLEAS